METMRWLGIDTGLELLDQRKLPATIEYRLCAACKTVEDGIRDMVVRGAPAIGVAAAYGMAMAAKEAIDSEDSERWNKFAGLAKSLRAARPTAVNLMWAVDRQMALAQTENEDWHSLVCLLTDAAEAMEKEDVAVNWAIGAYGQALLKDGDTVLTHCNAGALATAGYGTALGVIRGAVEAGKKIHVFADETRPYLQGARLTMSELMADGISCNLLCDNMAGFFMEKGKISCAVVGADRIAANGDTANKIGTMQVAVLCHYFKIPFYVAAPVSTIDRSIQTGEDIHIEMRHSDEVTKIFGRSIAPEGAEAMHPGFDVTPNQLITAIITEKGVITSPYEENLRIL